jgi:hypothetical protein
MSLRVREAFNGLLPDVRTNHVTGQGKVSMHRLQDRGVMKYCKEFNKFCEEALDCLDCYDHIGKLNRDQYKFALKKRESDRIERWRAANPCNFQQK